MKRILSLIFVVYSFLLLSFSAQAADVYTLDPNHTYVLWHANHFGFSNPSGKWVAEGTLSLDEKKPENSKVKVTIKIGDLVTGIKKFDEHLKGKTFFNVEQFPTATFVSNKVNVIDKDTAKVQGILTIRDVSKPVTLDVKLNKKGTNPVNNKETVGFSAHTLIKRSDFGISAYLPGVGDEIKIQIEAEGAK